MVKHDREELPFSKVTIRLDFVEYRSWYEMSKIGIDLYNKHKISMDTINFSYESPRVVRTTGSVPVNAPESIIRCVRRKFRLFKKPEYILDIQLQTNGSFKFGRFD